ncbi:MAG: metal ABC transporter substrate-binding protein [Defluviitaleaceae bacterium]|nr:metal ABC transporter substrate-binding protein [Defluviitaleaceae bacterium]
MKRIIALLLALALLAGCAQTIPVSEPEIIVIDAETMEPIQESTAESLEAPLQIVTTIFPSFDFIRQIAGDRVELTMLLSPGAESHSFEPTPRDMVTLSNADLFIYVGGHSDTWVHPILESLERTDMRTVALMDLVNTLWEDHGDHHHHDDHDHDHDDHHHHDDHEHDHDDHHHHDEPQLDEHVWTSPINAIMITSTLTDVLAETDPANADYFRANAYAFIQELGALDQAMAQMTANSIRNTVVFGDRFPFIYLTESFHLNHYSAFVGCSSETQASPATVAFLIEKVRDEHIPVVFYIEFSDQSIANVIAEATGARTLELHSAHNVSQADFDAGITYLEIMYRNMEHLREALN